MGMLNQSNLNASGNFAKSAKGSDTKDNTLANALMSKMNEGLLDHYKKA